MASVLTVRENPPSPSRHGAKDGSSSTLARRALFITLAFAFTGSGFGVVGYFFGSVAGPELGLVVASLLFSASALLTMQFGHDVELQRVATVSTIGFLINLCAGSMIAVYGTGQHENLFVYLFWFFPLAVFNKLVNKPAVGRLLGRSLQCAPLFVIFCLSRRLMALFSSTQLIVLAVWCLSYVGFGLMFGAVTRYREEFIVERERAESLKIESEVLESISDCFISLDSEWRLAYLNNAACAEFGIEREMALKDTIEHAAPGFLSRTMLDKLRTAQSQAGTSMFEAQNEKRDVWYEMRCFPGRRGMSVYFRNVTESVSSRRKLEEAQLRLGEQAELLDKARDAILVQDLDNRVLYWNRSAERLYGWTAEEVIGRQTRDVFHDSLAEFNKSIDAVLRLGEWDGELSQRRRDGTALIVESRCTLVRAEDGQPRSILAINTDITNRKTAENKIRHLAYYDVLTELPNRLLLRERLEDALVTSVRHGEPGALLYIDLDDFKTINDTLGHDTGDLLLQQVAMRLTLCVRAGDTVARLGGDEFVVMLKGLGKDARIASAEAAGMANRILEAFLQPYEIHKNEHTSTASIGIALFPGDAVSVDELLKRADLAMYRAKAGGANSLCFFDPAMETYVASRATLKSDLRRALQNRDFALHYQPQLHSNGKITGAEALLRWRHPQRGMVAPAEFIPLAEDAGLIADLGRWVLQTACAQLASWATRPDMESLEIAVNVSVRQFRDANFVNIVAEVLQESRANPNRLKLEITESSMMDDVEDVIAKMVALKVRGVGFSLDDFGTGYSSLSHLRRLPLNQIKIDRSFVNDVLTDVRDASIVRTIISLGQNLNLTVIAEGVETEGQRRFLEEEGCHVYQGYLFSPALTVPQFDSFVARAQLQDQMASSRQLSGHLRPSAVEEALSTR
jgi:diguanylate cyclase (GGDEF)-like protein/PAS domain S-box-containing protein